MHTLVLSSFTCLRIKIAIWKFLHILIYKLPFKFFFVVVVPRNFKKRQFPDEWHLVCLFVVIWWLEKKKKKLWALFYFILFFVNRTVFYSQTFPGRSFINELFWKLILDSFRFSEPAKQGLKHYRLVKKDTLRNDHIQFRNNLYGSRHLKQGARCFLHRKNKLLH